MVFKFNRQQRYADTASPQSGRRSIVILSSDDWGWKTSKYQLSVRLAQTDTVLFVSSIGFRSPSLLDKSDMFRIFKKLGSFFKGIKTVKPHLGVMTPIVIPFKRFPARAFFNRLLFKWQFGMALKKMGMQSPHLLVFSQNWSEYVEGLPSAQVCYYVVDKQAGFKGVDDQAFARWDQSLVAQANLVVCCARSTFHHYQQQHQKVHYLPHGVNYAHYARSVSESPLAQPQDLKAIKQQQRLLFFGHISKDWVDMDLLEQLSQALPEVGIVLLGRLSLSEQHPVLQRPNIHWLGEKAFEVLPAYCAHCQVGLIPFVDSELTRNCNPLKLPEYLAAGLPVVSTAIPEVAAFEPSQFVTVASTSQAFIEGCREALEMVSLEQTPEQQLATRRSISQQMTNETWEDRVSQLRHWLFSPEQQGAPSAVVMPVALGQSQAGQGNA